MISYVGSINDRMLLESSCKGCNGSCKTCFIDNEGEKNMTDLDRRFTEAVGPHQRAESEEDLGYDRVFRITPTGVELTPASKRDEVAHKKAVRAREEKKKTRTILTEAEIDRKFKEILL